MPTDCQLLRQEEQFTQCFREFSPRIFYYLKKQLRRDDIAEDLLQDIFASIWNRRDYLFSEKPVRPDTGAYLFVTTRNHLFNYLRKSLRENQHAANLPAAEPVQWTNSGQDYSPVEEYLDGKVANEYYQSIIDSLSPQRKQAFQLSRDQQLTYQEIADRMGIAPRTVEKHISAALQTIRDRMTEFSLMVSLLMIW